MTLLNKYLIYKFIKSFFIVLIAIILLILLVDLIELTRRLAEQNSFFKIVKISLYHQPSLIIEILPFIILLASILFFYQLSNSSELIILETGGVSKIKIFFAPLCIIVFIALFEIFVLSHISFKASYAFFEQAGKLDKILVDKEQKLWFKQDDYIFKADGLDIGQDKIGFSKVKLLFLAEQNEQIIFAKQAELELKDGVFTLYDTITDSGVVKKKIMLHADFTRDYFIDKFTVQYSRNNKNLFYKDLLAKISMAKHAKESFYQEKAALFYVFVRPLMYIVLFMLAAFYCIYPPRAKNKNLKIAYAILSGFLCFLGLNILYNVTLANNLTIVQGIILPHLFLLLGAIYILQRKGEV